MFKQNDLANIKNIIWAIEKIENSILGIESVDQLIQNEEKFDSIVIKLMNIGESAFNISAELKKRFPEVDWNGMYKMRNIITHAYHAIDENIVWDIIKNELPEDKKKIQSISLSF